MHKKHKLFPIKNYDYAKVVYHWKNSKFSHGFSQTSVVNIQNADFSLHETRHFVMWAAIVLSSKALIGNFKTSKLTLNTPKFITHYLSFYSVDHGCSTQYGQDYGPCTTCWTSSWWPTMRSSGPTPWPGPCIWPTWDTPSWACSPYVTVLWPFMYTLNVRIFCLVGVRK